MDTNKSNAAGMAFRSYILSIDNNILLKPTNVDVLLFISLFTGLLAKNGCIRCYV